MPLTFSIRSELALAETGPPARAARLLVEFAKPALEYAVNEYAVNELAKLALENNVEG